MPLRPRSTASARSPTTPGRKAPRCACGWACTRALVGNELPEGVSVRDLGKQHLKDVQYEHVYELSLEEERHDFPPLKEERTGRADAMAEDFGKRIEAHVEQQLEAAFSRALGGKKSGSRRSWWPWRR